MTFSLMTLSIEILGLKMRRHNNTKLNDTQGYDSQHIGNIIMTQRLTVKMLS
jgi:hypothetical protein